MPEPAMSPNSCSVCEAHATCSAAACRYTSDPEYKSAMEVLARKEAGAQQILARKEEILAGAQQILLELLRKEARLEENLLRSQGELLGPCCGALVGCRSRGGPEGCTSGVNSLSARGCWHVHCWAARVPYSS